MGWASVINDIKNVKIQGATNIAIQGLELLVSYPAEFVKIKSALLKARPTEPMLRNLIKEAEANQDDLAAWWTVRKHVLLIELDSVSSNAVKLVEGVVVTHCHSGSVTHSLIKAHKSGKDFRVFCSETRPLYQGRLTATELVKAGVDTTLVVDSHIALFLKHCSAVFIGCDSFTKNGFLNKVGSLMICTLARLYCKPVFVVTHSLKFSDKLDSVEQRLGKEVWDSAPRKLKIDNPAFDFVPKNLVTKVITENGSFSFDELLGWLR